MAVKTDRLTGNIDFSTSAKTVSRTGGVGGGYKARGDSPLAQAVEGAFKPLVSLVPMIIKSGKKAEYERLYSKLNNQLYDARVSGKNKAIRAGIKNEFGKTEISANPSNRGLVNDVLRNIQVMQTKDVKYGGQTFVADSDGNILGRGKEQPARLRAVDYHANNVTNMMEKYPRFSKSTETGIYNKLNITDKATEQMWGGTASLQSQSVIEVDNVLERIVASSIPASVINTESIDQLKTRNKEDFLSAYSRARGELLPPALIDEMGKPDSKVSLAAAEQALSSLQLDIHERIAKSDGLFFEGTGYGVKDLNTMFENDRKEFKEKLEWVTGAGSKRGTANTRLALVTNAQKLRYLFNKFNYLEKLKTGNPMQKLLYDHIIEGDLGVFSNIAAAGELFKNSNDPAGTRAIMDGLSNHAERTGDALLKTLQMAEQTPKMWEASSTYKMFSLFSGLLRGSPGLFNDNRRDESIRIARKYAKFLKERDGDGDANASETLEKVVNNYEETMTRAVGLLKLGLK
jgi:hypothetical protein